jgi:hypothetical protein
MSIILIAAIFGSVAWIVYCTARRPSSILTKPVTLTVINQSSVVLTADLAAAVAAVQKQLSNEFKAAWHIDATLVIGASPASLFKRILAKIFRTNAEPWPVYIRDHSDKSGALGYHNPGRPPITYVFAADCAPTAPGQLPWTVCLSHEILEMLVDPQLTRRSATSQYEEVGDPVETATYSIDGVLVTDFVYPSYFDAHGNAPYDYLRLLTLPGQQL